jgi:hypothetical protein
MENPTWPSTLPAPQDEAGQYAPLVENVITSSMETGAPKTRRRFTAMPEVFTGSLLVTSAQAATLDGFYRTTLKEVLPFDWKDFRDGTSATYTFKKAPTFARAPGSRSTVNPYGLWRATLELVKKP